MNEPEPRYNSGADAGDPEARRDAGPLDRQRQLAVLCRDALQRYQGPSASHRSTMGSRSFLRPVDRTDARLSRVEGAVMSW